MAFSRGPNVAVFACAGDRVDADSRSDISGPGKASRKKVIQPKKLNEAEASTKHKKAKKPKIPKKSKIPVVGQTFFHGDSFVDSCVAMGIDLNTRPPDFMDRLRPYRKVKPSDGLLSGVPFSDVSKLAPMIRAPLSEVIVNIEQVLKGYGDSYDGIELAGKCLASYASSIDPERVSLASFRDHLKKTPLDWCLEEGSIGNCYVLNQRLKAELLSKFGYHGQDLCSYSGTPKESLPIEHASCGYYVADPVSQKTYLVVVELLNLGHRISPVELNARTEFPPNKLGTVGVCDAAGRASFHFYKRPLEGKPFDHNMVIANTEDHHALINFMYILGVGGLSGRQFAVEGDRTKKDISVIKVSFKSQRRGVVFQIGKGKHAQRYIVPFESWDNFKKELLQELDSKPDGFSETAMEKLNSLIFYQDEKGEFIHPSRLLSIYERSFWRPLPPFERVLASIDRLLAQQTVLEHFWKEVDQFHACTKKLNSSLAQLQSGKRDVDTLLSRLHDLDGLDLAF